MSSLYHLSWQSLNLSALLAPDLILDTLWMKMLVSALPHNYICHRAIPIIGMMSVAVRTP